MSRVIFLSRGDKDISSSEDFGEPVFLLSKNPNPFQLENLIDSISERLDSIGFDPDADYIAMTGSGVCLAILFGIIVDWYENPIKILIFDASSLRYKARVFVANLGPRSEEEKEQVTQNE